LNSGELDFVQQFQNLSSIEIVHHLGTLLNGTVTCRLLLHLAQLFHELFYFLRKAFGGILRRGRRRWPKLELELLQLLLEQLLLIDLRRCLLISVGSLLLVLRLVELALAVGLASRLLGGE